MRVICVVDGEVWLYISAPLKSCSLTKPSGFFIGHSHTVLKVAHQEISVFVEVGR